MRLETTMKDIQIKFGQFDVDMEVEFTVCMGYYLDTSGSPELLYDELKMLMEVNVNLVDDKMQPTIKKF
jgi:hypothetical protein